MLTKEELKKYRAVGKIVAEVRDFARTHVREGMRIIDLCLAIEEQILKKGAKPAFPCNVCINNVAAHYTPPIDDTTSVPENSVVKIDIGAHIDGYIADTAETVCFSYEHEPLSFAARKAIESVCNALKPNIHVSKLGSIIKATVNQYGFKPISNLTGHKIERYNLHAGKCIPNVPIDSNDKIKYGEIYAIEPFVTEAQGAGRVVNSSKRTILRLVKDKPLRNEDQRYLLSVIKERFNTLPFTERWLIDIFPLPKLRNLLKDLLKQRVLSAYPVLVEAAGSIVAQAEHTVVILEDGAELLTSR